SSFFKFCVIAIKRGTVPHKKNVDVLANISFLIMYIYDGAANLVAARALPWVTYVSGATGCGCLELRLYVIRFCHL
ncbi:MAG TPA: hypothetical protein VE971_04235, partial [Candidatus Eisenbacteria bacterium]|nr:hypothetical protein [Candidatus Eisenbacteria bacterium]